MPLAVQCPTCSRELTVPDRLLGHKVKCPKCDMMFQAGFAPGQAAPSAAAAPPPKPVMAPAPASKPPTMAAATGQASKPPTATAASGTMAKPASPPSTNSAGGGTALVICQGCTKQLSIPGTMLGKTIKCPSCTTLFQARAMTPDDLKMLQTALTSSTAVKAVALADNEDDFEDDQPRSRRPANRHRGKKRGGSPLPYIIGGSLAVLLLLGGGLAWWLWPSGSDLPAKNDSSLAKRKDDADGKQPNPGRPGRDQEVEDPPANPANPPKDNQNKGDDNPLLREKPNRPAENRPRDNPPKEKEEEKPPKDKPREREEEEENSPKKKERTEEEERPARNNPPTERDRSNRRGGGRFEVDKNSKVPSAKGMPGLIGYWNFDEGDGDKAADSSSSGNHGKVQGEWAQGVRGGAFQGNGNGSFCELGNSAKLNFKFGDPFTITGWFQAPPRGQGRNGVILAFQSEANQNSQLAIFLNIHGQLVCTARSDNSPRGEASVQSQFDFQHFVNDGQWHHFAVIRHPKDGGLEMYVDGVSVGTDTRAEGQGAITTDMRAIGAEPHAVRNQRGRLFAVHPHFQGLIDEVCIFDRALERSDVRKLAGKE